MSFAIQSRALIQPLSQLLNYLIVKCTWRNCFVLPRCGTSVFPFMSGFAKHLSTNKHTLAMQVRNTRKGISSGGLLPDWISSAKDKGKSSNLSSSGSNLSTKVYSVSILSRCPLTNEIVRWTALCYGRRPIITAH